MFLIFFEIFSKILAVSPNAFFQVNTKAAEHLLSIVCDFAIGSDTKNSKHSKKSKIILDVCCGTGVMGIAVAKNAPGSRVVGLELVKSATKDALKNAKLNNVDNYSVVCGRVEDTIKETLTSDASMKEEGIAIVDPPRAGLHRKALNAIRNCSAIRRIVYISCNPESLIRDLVALGAPQQKMEFSLGKRTIDDVIPIGKETSKRIKLDDGVETKKCETNCNSVDHVKSIDSENKVAPLPFVPIKVQPVDMFPQTPHCETVVLLERSSEPSAKAFLVGVTGRDYCWKCGDPTHSKQKCLTRELARRGEL